MKSLAAAVVVLLAALLTSCAPGTPREIEVTREVEVTRQVEVLVTVEVEVTRIARMEVTRVVEVTQIVTATPEPTATPTFTPSPTPTAVPTNTSVPRPTNTPAPVAPTETPAPPAPTSPPQQETWTLELNVSKQCGHFEYKVYDLRRVKDVYFYDNAYIAQGEFLLLFIEVKNISGGTSYFGQFGPRVVALSAPGAGSGAAVTGKSKASRYAQWMYQSGSFYEDINPGNVLGLAEAYDLPADQEYFLAFGLESCAETNASILSLGMWSQVPRGHKK